MDKKVIIINGSSRKKNTYSLLLQIQKILKEREIETEILNLFDYEIKHCVGCESCVTSKACCLKDDLAKIKEKIINSDGVVLSSPVYMRGVTSKFKSFTDRLNELVHKPISAGKPMMFVTTTAATGLKETGKFLRDFATGIGARKGDFVSRTNKNMKEPVKIKEISKFLKLLEKDEKDYRPAMNEIVMFTVGKVMALKSNADDRKFWEEKEWINKSYYYKCKMNPLKKIFSKFIFKVISKAMK